MLGTLFVCVCAVIIFDRVMQLKDNNDFHI